MEEKRSSFSEADIERLRQHLKLSYTERFLLTTRLYKIHQTMKKATITHKPFISK